MPPQNELEKEQPLAQNKKTYQGRAVFFFKFNDVPVDMMVLKDVQALLTQARQDTVREVIEKIWTMTENNTIEVPVILDFIAQLRKEYDIKD